MRKGRAGGDAARKRNRFVMQRLATDQPIVETPALALLGGHDPAGVEQIGGAALADDPRQNRAGAHVASGKADAGEQEGGLGRWRGEAEVRCHRHDCARTDADAVDRRDDRLRAGAHRLDQIAGHAGEGEQFGHRHLGQRADDLMDVTARGEIAARAGDHHRLDLWRVDEIPEGIAQFGIAFERERVLALGPVERDGRDAISKGPAEMHRREAGRIHGHSFPLSAASESLSVPSSR